MLHFMIDFENVKNTGLYGCEYLNEKDSMTIFYSSCCSQIESGRMRQILESGCRFDICKLQNAGKNALDFYLVSHIGEVFGKGYEGEIGPIIDIIQARTTPKILYLDTLKKFGRRDGLEIYSRIKRVI